jgi:hypothetical protein
LRRSPGIEGLSLHSRLTGTGHHLLLFAGPGTDVVSREGVEEAARVLAHELGDVMEVKVIVGGGGAGHGVDHGACLDDTGELHRRYGLTGPGCYLVRPDGHIAFRSSGTDLGALAAYLRRTFLAPEPATPVPGPGR